MTKPTLYQRCAHHGDLRMQSIHDCDGYMPVEPDIEAAKVPATDTFAMFASKMLGISHAEAMQRDDVQEAGAIIAAATIGAALGLNNKSYK